MFLNLVLYLLQEKHCSTSLVKEDELQAHIPQESKLCVIPQLTRKTTVNFQTKDKENIV